MALKVSTGARTGETLDMLADSYGALVKAGKESLSAAYRFGSIIAALHPYWTYTAMAEYLGITTSTISKYARLARKFSTESQLLRAAEQMETHDVGILAGLGVPSGHWHTEYHCTNCGSGSEAIEKLRVAGPKEPVTEAVSA